MATTLYEVVIAGSSGFGLALAAPLAERIGTQPRIAAEPPPALGPGSGLVVIEFKGPRTLEGIQKLLARSADAAVVVVVPDGHAGALETIRALGVEAVRWDGRPDTVLAAVARRLAGPPQPVAPAGPALTPAPRAGRPALTPVPPAAPALTPVPPARPALTPAPARRAPVARPAPAAALAAAAGAAAPAAAERFDEESLELDAMEHASDPFAVVPVPAAPGDAWPADLPGMLEAADALVRGLQGSFVPGQIPFAAVAEVVEGLSPVEQAVFSGEPQPVDADLIRRAAVMRVRVRVALTTAPAPGTAPVDAAAVSALLAELDALFAEVNALVASAPAELQPSLEQVRNALVKEAIDFSEAAHRAAPAEVAAPVRPTPEARKAAQTRIVSVASKAEQAIAAAEAKRSRTLLVVAAIAVLGVGGYHGYGWYQRHRPGLETPRVSGAPADVLVIAPQLPGGGPSMTTIQTRDGRAFTNDELNNLNAQQALRSNTVKVIRPGVVVVVRAPTPSRAPASAPVPATAPVPANAPAPATEVKKP